ncbi:MAG: hypothetical protein A3F73_04100 [Gallionellales bacterium RIFCSPLOWO2_12_FULL_59_22]|nr:MAG: hypothetical protein A3H99_01235 [Gallionellales bacterium RIFCSPLOWO2_02_FULL_59_110]OGT14006.1 MAG: hypothetical protein A3F73_04100 [Gallionellales bacterium RIFCSPLOWO2_12_FULL_59_22]
MTEQRHRKDSPFAAQWLIFGVAASLLGALLAWNIYRGYAETGAMERERLSIRAKIAAENMARQLDSVGRMLSGLRDDWARWEKLEDGSDRANRRMAAMADVMTGVRFIAVFDARGRISATSQKEFIGQDFSHRDYFQAPLRNPDPDTLYVSPPYRNVSGVYTISMSRAIIAPDGRFAGAVMASLEPEEFRMLMNSVRYAPDMRAYLIHGDGVVFMAVPEQEGLTGKNVAAEPGSFFNRHIASGLAGSVISGMAPVVGEERMMVLRTSQPAAQRMNKSMVIAVSRNLPEIFAGWRREAGLEGGLFGVLVLVSGTGLFAYQRRQRNFNRLVAVYQAEQRKVAERLKLATEAASVGVWEHDLVSGKLFWDDSMFAIYGVRPESFSADYTAWRNSLLPEDVAEAEAATKPALEGKSYDICFRIRRGDGQVRTIRALARAYFDESGKAVRMVGINEDITERKRTEEALQESEAMLQATMKILPVGLWIMNAEGKIIFGNAAGQRIWAGAHYVGVEQFGEYKGWWLDNGKPVGPHDWAAARAIEKGETSIEEEIEIECFDGTHKIIFNSALPLRKSDGSISGAVIVNQDITERKQAEEQVRTLAFYDTLTHLPNRRLLDDRLRQAMAASKRSGMYCAAMFLDLDNFKPLNDTHGHDVGDLLLVEAARRIASCVREADTVARFGGDEFVVMLGELDADKAESAAQAGAVAEKIRSALAEPYELKFQRDGSAEATVVHRCTSSVGVVLFINHEAGPDEVLKWADMAMYRAKEGGRNRVHFHGS